MTDDVQPTGLTETERETLAAAALCRCGGRCVEADVERILAARRAVWAKPLQTLADEWAAKSVPGEWSVALHPKRAADRLRAVLAADNEDNPTEEAREFVQCPHEMIEATCAGFCNCPCDPCAPSRPGPSDRAATDGAS